MATAAPPMSDRRTADLRTADLRRFGRTVVVAPHPDDEALGCGGLVALLGQLGQPVAAVLVSDGSASHPGSRDYDSAQRQALRAAEWAQGLACLGVPAKRLHALGWPDGRVPAPGDATFEAAALTVQRLLARLAPQTLVLPWRRDPHPDHRASHALFAQALAGLPSPLPRCLEYTVWLHERAAADDLPRAGETQAWRLDIAPVLAAKQQAIACHRSQLGQCITDDPQGFLLPAGLLARAREPFEWFHEAVP